MENKTNRSKTELASEGTVTIERAIVTAIKASMARDSDPVPAVLFAYARARAGKPVTVRDVAALEAILAKGARYEDSDGSYVSQYAVRIVRELGWTKIVWTARARRECLPEHRAAGWRMASDWGSAASWGVIVARTEKGATWPADVDAWIEAEGRHYEGQSARNAQRDELLEDFARDSSRPLHLRASAITTAARQIKAVREAEAALERLTEGLDDARTEMISSEISSVLKGGS